MTPVICRGFESHQRLVFVLLRVTFGPLLICPGAAQSRVFYGSGAAYLDSTAGQRIHQYQLALFADILLMMYALYITSNRYIIIEINLEIIYNTYWLSKLTIIKL